MMRSFAKLAFPLIFVSLSNAQSQTGLSAEPSSEIPVTAEGNIVLDLTQLGLKHQLTDLKPGKSYEALVATLDGDQEIVFLERVVFEAAGSSHTIQLFQNQEEPALLSVESMRDLTFGFILEGEAVAEVPLETLAEQAGERPAVFIRRDAGVHAKHGAKSHGQMLMKPVQKTSETNALMVNRIGGGGGGISPPCVLPTHAGICFGSCENACKTTACAQIALCGYNWVCKALAVADYNTCIRACDYDGDGHTNYNDNCPCNANSNQADCDGDTIGDVCDPENGFPGTAYGAWETLNYQLVQYCFNYNSVCSWVPGLNCSFPSPCGTNTLLFIGYTEIEQRRAVYDAVLGCNGQIISQTFSHWDYRDLIADPYYLGCCI